MPSVTKEQIDILIKLEMVETEIRTIKSILEEIPKKLDTLNARLEAFETTITDKETAFFDMQKKYRENESDVQMNLDSIKKSNEKLMSVKTNKEYQAILKEIEDLEKKNSMIEDQMLAYLERIETEEKSVGLQKQEYLQEKEQIEREKNTIELEKDEKKKKLVLLEADRNDIAKRIAPMLLNRYEVIRNQVKGEAIVAIKDAVCQGCHLNVPPQMYNELQRRDTLIFCPHCHRIIYWK